jgi:hypothetical protein
VSDTGWQGYVAYRREESGTFRREHEAGQLHRHDATKETPVDNSNAALRQQIDALQVKIRALQSPVSETERDALRVAQYRCDSVTALLGMGVSPPGFGETSLAYRRRAAAALQFHSPDLKNTRLDSVDSPTLAALEDRIYNDAVSAARGRDTPGRLHEVKERDASGRLITRYTGDPMAWMQHFMGQGHSGFFNRKPNG